jgi:hypothetical protein
MKYKRGLSGVIVSILVVLLVVIGLSLVWFFVRPVIENVDKSEGFVSELSGLEIDKYSDSGKVTVCNSGCDVNTLEGALDIVEEYEEIIIGRGVYIEDWENLFEKSKPNVKIRGVSKDDVIIRNDGMSEKSLKILPGSSLSNVTIDCNNNLNTVGLVMGLKSSDPDNWKNSDKKYEYHVSDINTIRCNRGIQTQSSSGDPHYPVEGDHYFYHENILMEWDERDWESLSIEKPGDFSAYSSKWIISPDPGFKPNMYLYYKNVTAFIFNIDPPGNTVYERDCYTLMNHKIDDDDAANYIKVNQHLFMNGFNCYFYDTGMKGFISTLWEIRNDFDSRVPIEHRSFDTIDVRNSYWNIMVDTDCQIYPGTVDVTQNSNTVIGNGVDFVDAGVEVGSNFMVDGNAGEIRINSVQSNQLELGSDWSWNSFTNAEYRICDGRVYGLSFSPDKDPEKNIPACIIDKISIISYDPVQEIQENTLLNGPFMGNYPTRVYPMGGIIHKSMIDFCDGGGSEHNDVYTNKWVKTSNGEGVPQDHLDNYMAQFQPDCTNSLDDDNDGKFDFPNDPDCDSPFDNDESGTSVYKCSDDIDNNMDGDVDWPYDDNCWGATDNSE